MAITTGVLNGNRVLVFSDNEAIACSTGATLNLTNEQVETTCKDNDGAKTYTAGAQDWSIDCQVNSKLDAS